MSQGEWQIPFILELEQTGCEYNHAALRDTAHQLTYILPSHQHTVARLSAAIDSEEHFLLHQMLYGPPPPNVAYNVKVILFQPYYFYSIISLIIMRILGFVQFSYTGDGAFIRTMACNSKGMLSTHSIILRRHS